MKPIEIVINVCIVLIAVCALYIVNTKELRKRAKRFDLRWLALMKEIVNRLEIDYQLKLLSENDYRNLMKEINEQMEEYEKWLSKIVG